MGMLGCNQISAYADNATTGYGYEFNVTLSRLALVGDGETSEWVSTEEPSIDDNGRQVNKCFRDARIW